MTAEGRFTGKTLMVTGAAGNIGFATARRFAEEGANVALVDINEEGLRDAVSKIRGGNGVATFHVCDATDARAVDRVVDEIVSRSGQIDFLFNNAGYQGLFCPMHEYPADDFRTVIDINVNGVFHFLQAVAAHMVTTGGGAIVNTASMAGVQGPPNMAAYAASKFAVIGLTQTASKDLAPYNIRVNAISPAFMGPGFMWDRQVKLQAEVRSQYFSADPKTAAEQMIKAVPMRRLGGIAEIPGTVAFLMSEDASYITGVNIPIAGGIL
ncbi:SDR family NAD(P)-dependent oxidoreductase [Roseinatronobacter monicus]|uniref:NAD(P)-dependent dehydrogenase (Short-subunit alcohol dehydrogenase family) n=1 Tax=Roseinatronobacter monicus TaxID=393481 RepID=A0A543K3L8_9RHOB|nr:SDR family NAD(P)-dependent oxidoreductase [Roseinatronobacter monicus]TQM89663.1 NAD(P)-dependent dehydrogenase (short-subunit alcohol dehydrogenase family) [Roseinatronobacter monicus]